MKRPRTRTLVLAGLTIVLTTSWLATNGNEQVRRIPVEAPAVKKSLRPFMHSKLIHSGKVFEGLVTRDFAKIHSGAEALKLTTLSAPEFDPGETRNDEVFEHFKLEFVRLAGRLEQMADEKNLEGAAYTTQQLNATCIACHGYLRDRSALASR